MRLLLIEDEQNIINFLKPSLEAELFAVDIAEDGEVGSYLARTNNYDIIILDNILPIKTGLEICKEVRESGKNVPIIVLSVRTETTIKVNLLNAGADDYLSKPFSLDELLARVRALLRRPKEVRTHILQIDDLVLYPSIQRVERACKVLDLSNKEKMLLEYMMRNPGSILSRGMLMEHVWDMSVDPFSRTVDAHIQSLRSKIDLPGMKKLIHTHPKQGYSISPPKTQTRR